MDRLACGPFVAPGAPERAARYEFVRKVGEGAFGEVHEARDTLSGARVACKLVRLPPVNGSGGRGGFGGGGFGGGFGGGGFGGGGAPNDDDLDLPKVAPRPTAAPCVGGYQLSVVVQKCCTLCDTLLRNTQSARSKPRPRRRAALFERTRPATALVAL